MIVPRDTQPDYLTVREIITIIIVLTAAYLVGAGTALVNL